MRPKALDTSPTVAELVLRDGTLYEVTANQVARWETVYPDVLVMDTLREMATWLEANERRRKTRGGILRFINGWMNREQNAPRLVNHEVGR